MPTETYQAHDAANIFPLDEEHIDELAEDIKANGLQVPIEMLGDKIIDGRRRWLACERADVEPDIIPVDPVDPVAYVLSLNLHRRHLTESQRAMIGARAREQYEKAAKERQKESGGDRKTAAGKKRSASGDAHRSDPPHVPGHRGRASRHAGEAVGVSAASIDRARHVLESENTELIQAVDGGKMSVARASRIARDVEPPEPSSGKAAWKSKTIQRPILEKLAKQLDKLDKMVSKPSLTIPIASVKKTVRELREAVSRILE